MNADPSPLSWERCTTWFSSLAVLRTPLSAAPPSRMRAAEHRWEEGGIHDVQLSAEGRSMTERAHTSSRVGKPLNITVWWWPIESEEIDSRNGWRGREEERTEISYWTWCQHARKKRTCEEHVTWEERLICVIVLTCWGFHCWNCLLNRTGFQTCPFLLSVKSFTGKVFQ